MQRRIGCGAAKSVNWSSPRVTINGAGSPPRRNRIPGASGGLCEAAPDPTEDPRVQATDSKPSQCQFERVRRHRSRAPQVDQARALPSCGLATWTVVWLLADAGTGGRLLTPWSKT